MGIRDRVMMGGWMDGALRRGEAQGAAARGIQKKKDVATAPKARYFSQSVAIFAVLGLAPSRARPAQSRLRRWHPIAAAQWRSCPGPGRLRPKRG